MAHNTTSRSASNTSWRRIARDQLPLVIMAVVLLAARSSLADHYVIPSGSMEHTLVPGDHVLVDKLAYGAHIPFLGYRLTSGDAPQRGEVVIFDSPENGIRLIKRVVAVGGDLVSLEDGALYLNGKSQRADDATPGEPYEVFGDHVARLNMRYGGGPNIHDLRVPAGKLLVVGDSRGNSRDGRFFGLIDEGLLYARANRVIYRRGEGLVWKPL